MTKKSPKRHNAGVRDAINALVKRRSGLQVAYEEAKAHERDKPARMWQQDIELIDAKIIALEGLLIVIDDELCPKP